jgi:hypothetical protein
VLHAVAVVIPERRRVGVARQQQLDHLDV